MPGHLESDPILRSNCRSAIATPVERQTWLVMLVWLPECYGAVAVREVAQERLLTRTR